MSNIGKQSIDVPEGVNIDLTNSKIGVKGSLGELYLDFNPEMKVVFKDNKISDFKNNLFHF